MLHGKNYAGNPIKIIYSTDREIQCVTAQILKDVDDGNGGVFDYSKLCS
jgi:hypothetical protein